MLTDEMVTVPPTARRFVQLDGQPKAAADEFEATLSTTAPVERGWGVEILEHTVEAVDMERARNGLPLLLDHDPTKQVGRVVDVRLVGKRLRGRLRFGNGQLAQDVLADVRDGIRQELSVGYDILVTMPGEGREVRVTRWTPMEVSIVSIPADPASAIGRNKGSQPMSTETRTAASPAGNPAHANPPQDAQRQAEIMALADLANMREAGVNATLRGITTEQFRAELLTARQSDRPLGTPHLSNGGAPGDGQLEQRMREVGLVDVIRAGMGERDRKSGLAREMSEELQRRSGRRAQGIMWHMGERPVAGPQQRVFTTTAPGGGPGSNLVATNQLPQFFISRLYPMIRVRELGATVLSGLIGNVDVPRLKASAASGWVAENAALSVTDPQTDKVSLTPKTAGVLVEVSRNMVMQATPDIESLLQDDMARTLGVALDSAAIAGTGTSNQPLGILGTSGIGDVAMGTNGGNLTFDAAADVMGAVADANAEMGQLAFLTNTLVRRQAAKLKDSQNRPLGLNVVFQGMPTAFTSCAPATLTKGTSSGNYSALLYGNWADLLIGLWSELDVLVNPYESTAYTKGNVQIRAMMTVDIAVRHPASFAAIKDITAPGTLAS